MLDLKQHTWKWLQVFFFLYVDVDVYMEFGTRISER